VTAPESPSQNGGRYVPNGIEPGQHLRRISSNGLTDEGLDLDALRRTLDPEHPDPERLRQRVRSVLISTPVSAPDAEPYAETPDPELISPSPAAARPRVRSILGATTLVAAVIVLVALVVAAVVIVRGPQDASQPASPASSPQQFPAPQPTVPAGFRDCSVAFGSGNYCVDTPECWAGIISVSDVPSVATATGCASRHVYETFAAGVLEAPIQRQSQLEKSPQVKELCSTRTLGRLLGSRQFGADFEILVVPGQSAAQARLFRCLAGKGYRSGPLPFQHPR